MAAIRWLPAFSRANGIGIGPPGGADLSQTAAGAARDLAARFLGVPVQLVIGSKGLSRGVAERKLRSTGGRDELHLDALAGQPSLALQFAASSP